MNQQTKQQELAERIETELASFEQISKNLFELWVDYGANYEDEFMQIRRTICAATTRLQEFYETVKPEETNMTAVPI